jgi:hypothetical protein
VIPWRGNIVHLMNLLPASMKDAVGKAIGVHNQQSDFQGKGSMEKRIPGLNEKK